MNTTTEPIPEPTTAELRRESRRKKILETAKSRLERLNGRPRPITTNNSDHPEDLQYSDPEVEPDIPVGNTLFQEGFYRPFQPTANLQPVNPDDSNTFLRSKAHILIASIIGCILSHFVANSLFAPVGFCLIFELFYYKGQLHINNNIGNLVPVALLFTGAPMGNKIKQISCLLAISQSLIINLAVSIFGICLSSLLIQYVNISHVVDIK